MAERDDSTRVPLRTLIVLLLNTEAREELITSLTSNERRAVQYQYVTVPSLGRSDPDRIPDPPFQDFEMVRPLASALTKIEAWLEQPTDEGMR
jgi:hypothetical protein